MYFNFLQQSLFIISLILLFLSALLYEKGQTKFALLLLCAGAFALRYLAASVDPFLHDWDERFHALVARNMMTNPFVPMLRVNPVLPYDYKAWYGNHIWLHKQPLFLWQMALSMKVFGVNEMALRLPSIVMGTIQAIFIFRIGKIIWNERTGFYAALFSAMLGYNIQLIAGVASLDQNDAAFTFYITASIWAFCEYWVKKNSNWILWIGIFAGCAVLNKWLAGLLVYAIWIIALILNKNYYSLKKQNLNEIVKLITAIGITSFIFLPWQIYITELFPKEAAFEFSYNFEHIKNALGGHSGGWDFYIGRLARQYGPLSYLFIPFGFFILIRKSTLKEIVVAFLLVSIMVVTFFSFFVETKMLAFTFIICSIVAILFGAVICFVTEKITVFKKYYFLTPVCIFSLLFLTTLNLTETFRIYLFTSPDQSYASYRKNEINNTLIYRKLNESVPKNYVIFNSSPFNDISAMFYSDRNVYAPFPSKIQFDSLKKGGIKIAAFEDHDEYKLPDYFKNDTSVLIIHQLLLPAN